MEKVDDSTFSYEGDFLFYFAKIWRGGRVVEGSSLENCQACERLEGSNPSLSSIFCVDVDYCK